MKRKEPKFRGKVVAVAGDCMQPGLGLSLEHKNELVKNVSAQFGHILLEIQLFVDTCPMDICNKRVVARHGRHNVKYLVAFLFVFTLNAVVLGCNEPNIGSYCVPYGSHRAFR